MKRKCPLSEKQWNFSSAVELLGITLDKSLHLKTDIENICCKEINKMKALFRIWGLFSHTQTSKRFNRGIYIIKPQGHSSTKIDGAGGGGQGLKKMSAAMVGRQRKC